MSYLSTPSIIFTGDFQADVSTLNNVVTNYDNTSFGPGSPELWNPNGGSTFRFVNCEIKRCIQDNGEDDLNSPLLGLSVTGAKDKSSGKLVDLDPQMQMSSELWGVTLQISDSNDNIILLGDIHTSGFRDLQRRQFPTSSSDAAAVRNGQPLGGVWNTVIDNIQWTPEGLAIPMIAELNQQTHGDSLSLSMAAFGYYYAHEDGRFSMGRIVGTIAPYAANEPKRLAPTRRMYGTAGSFYQYTNYAVVDSEDRLLVDLGMSLPMRDPLGTTHPSHNQFSLAVANNQTFSATVGAGAPTIDPAEIDVIGPVDIRADNDWLMNTGGIVSLPLTSAQKTLLASNQLLLIYGTDLLVARETPGGVFARIDENVIRIDPGMRIDSSIYVSRFGQPVDNAEITLTIRPPETGSGVPTINDPPDRISATVLARTNTDGIAPLEVTGQDPGNPRSYIDGQIYSFEYGVVGERLDPYTFDQLIVHLRNAFTIPAAPTWSDVGEIWTQFANLYPIMSRHILDMKDIRDIYKHKDILLFSFSRPITDPMYMPVSRDLSANKMATLINWLNGLSENNLASVQGSGSSGSGVASAPVVPEGAVAADSLRTLLQNAKAGHAAALASLSEFVAFNSDGIA